jgi:hypothetical protein
MNQTKEFSICCCPLLKMGFNKCYHMQPDSSNVYAAITYCQNNHMECEIYNKLKDSELITYQQTKEEVK